MTWLRPQQGFGGGGGGGGGTGAAFVADVASDGVDVTVAGGAPALLNGVAMTVGRVALLKDQVAPAENGLYRVDIAGPGGTWTRIPELSTGAEFLTFFAVYVREGLVDPDVMYVLTTDPPYVVGVTPLAFSKYAPGGGGGAGGAVVEFSGAGQLGVGTNVGMWWWNRSGVALTITDVTMWREVSGTGGSTIGDVQVDLTGTGAAFASVYAAPDRPTIAAGTSPDFVQANVFASTAVPVGAVVRFNLDAVETGQPQNVVLQLTLV